MLISNYAINDIVLIKENFWTIEIPEQEYLYINNEMKEMEGRVSIVTRKARNGSLELNYDHFFHTNWVTPINNKDTLLEVYLKKRISDGIYEDRVKQYET